MSLPQKTVVAGLGTLGTFEGSVARFLARKLRRISNELTSYEPEGREFESLRARHFPLFSQGAALLRLKLEHDLSIG